MRIIQRVYGYLSHGGRVYLADCDCRRNRDSDVDVRSGEVALAVVDRSRQFFIGSGQQVDFEWFRSLQPKTGQSRTPGSSALAKRKRCVKHDPCDDASTFASAGWTPRHMVSLYPIAGMFTRFNLSRFCVLSCSSLHQRFTASSIVLPVRPIVACRPTTSGI